MSLNKLNTVSNNYGCSNSKADTAFELALFCKNFVEFTFTYFNITQTIYKVGKPPHNIY